MADKRKLLQRTMEKPSRAEVLHSSTYARAQSGGNFGAAEGETFAERRKIEEHLKFVKGYSNAQIMRGVRAVERAKTYTPRTGGRAESFRGSSLSGGSFRGGSGDSSSGGLKGRSASAPITPARSVAAKLPSTNVKPNFRPKF